MENRFGIKDLFLFLLIGALLVTTVVAMRQFDRQHEEVLTIKRQNSELTRDIAGIKRQLAEGVVAVGGGDAHNGASSGGATTRAAGPKVDAFTHLREAEAQPGFARGDWLIDNFATKIGKLTPLI